MLEEAGLIEQREGRLELTPPGIRAHRPKALGELFTQLSRDRSASHESSASATATSVARAQALRVRRPVQPRRRADRPQRHRAPGRRACRCSSSPTTSRSTRPSSSVRTATVLMVDLSLSMPMRDNFLPAKKVAMALHALISSQFPRDYLGIVGFSGWPASSSRRAAARGLLGLRLRHEHAARVPARPTAAGPRVGHQADHHDHRRRTDCAHHRLGETCCSTTRRSRRPSTRPSPRSPAARGRASASTRSCSTGPAPRRVHRAPDPTEPWSGVLHHTGDPGRLRAGRLPRVTSPSLAPPGGLSRRR